MKKRLQKTILSILLAVSLVMASPLAALAAGEAQTAPEAQTVQEAQQTKESQSSPESQQAPESQTAPEAQGTAEASPVTEPSPSPSPEPEAAADSTDESNQGYTDPQANTLLGENINSQNFTSGDGGQNNSGNVGNTSINTGDAQAAGTIVTNANSTAVNTPGTSGNCSICPTGEISVSNTGNGTDSQNSAALNLENSNSINIDNNAQVSNDLDFTALSGNNTASKNVGDSQITTGDANITATVITTANETGLGIAEFNVLDNHVGDIILTLPENFNSQPCSTCGLPGNTTVQNTENGEGSTNNAQANLSNESQTTIENDAYIVNNLDLNANTGDNSTSYNTGGDSTITTGDANVSANLVNLVNSTILDGAVFVVNVFGDLVGDIIFPDSMPSSQNSTGSQTTVSNTGNGADSQNSASLNTSNTSGFNIINNADIQNNLTIDATTGDNTASFNTGGESLVETGDVDVNAEILNVANVTALGTASDEPLWLILVNNMGTWTGKIIGSLTGTNFGGAADFGFTVDENGNITATNNGNGAGSANTAEINAQNSNSLTVDNNATVVNNVNISANTGGNKASYNTGGNSKITTGDVNVAASIVNFVNTVIKRPLMIGIINVFGSWAGDAVPPGYEPEAEALSSGGEVQATSQNNTTQAQNAGGSSLTQQTEDSNSQDTIQTAGLAPLEGLKTAFNRFPVLGQTTSENNGSSANPRGPIVFSSPAVGGFAHPDEKLLLAAIPLLLGAWLLLKKLKAKAVDSR